MNRKINILFIFSELFYGGAEKQFREIITRLNKDKYNISVVVTGAQKRIENKSLNDDFVKCNPEINFFFLKDVILKKGVWNKFIILLKFNIQLYNTIKKISPDIAVVYNGIELTSSYLLKRKGAKVIFSERESGDRGSIKLLRYKFFFKAVDCIVCNSSYAQEYYKKVNVKSLYIPNGINVDTPLLEESDDRFLIVVPARIARVKNQELLLRAVNELKEEKIKIIFIGKHEDKEYLNELKLLTKKFHLEAQVKFEEYAQNIKEFYKIADLIVLPSKMEGFTNVILESYMFGRLCLVSDIPMNRAIANQNQKFFSINNYKELASQIQQVLKLKKEEKDREIYNNYSFVIENYGMDKMVDRYEKLFEKIIKESRYDI